MKYTVELVKACKVSVEVDADNYLNAYRKATEIVEDDESVLYVEPYEETEYN